MVVEVVGSVVQFSFCKGISKYQSFNFLTGSCSSGRNSGCNLGCCELWLLEADLPSSSGDNIVSEETKE